MTAETFTPASLDRAALLARFTRETPHPTRPTERQFMYWEMRRDGMTHREIFHTLALTDSGRARQMIDEACAKVDAWLAYRSKPDG